MNSKECLEDIKLILYETLEFHMDVDELIEPIEQDLDRLEELKKENEKLKCKIHDLLDEKLELVLNNHNQSMGIAELMEKFIEFKKVIEILQRKILLSAPCGNLKPSIYINKDYDTLTQEQYELLKEVLKDEQ